VGSKGKACRQFKLGHNPFHFPLLAPVTPSPNQFDQNAGAEQEPNNGEVSKESSHATATITIEIHARTGLPTIHTHTSKIIDPQVIKEEWAENGF
jgi:hypothetical protein